MLSAEKRPRQIGYKMDSEKERKAENERGKENGENLKTGM